MAAAYRLLTIEACCCVVSGLKKIQGDFLDNYHVLTVDVADTITACDACRSNLGQSMKKQEHKGHMDVDWIRKSQSAMPCLALSWHYWRITLE